MNGVAFTGSWLPILHLGFLSDVMSRQKRLFPTITKSNSKSQSKQNCYEPRKTVISNNYKIRRARCKNLRLQSIGWLNNLYNFFETRMGCDWISLNQCILSLDLDCLHHYIIHIKMIMYKNLLSKVALQIILLTYQPTKGQLLINLSSK